jgi:WD40 repeat protein
VLFQSLAHAREEELDRTSDGVWAVARAPGTALVVTASEDEKVKLWKCDELEAERTTNIFSFYFSFSSSPFMCSMVASCCYLDSEFLERISSRDRLQLLQSCGGFWND